MRQKWVLCVTAACWVVASALPGTHLVAQDETGTGTEASHDMWSMDLGGGWQTFGMAQVFPIVTIGAPLVDDSPLSETSWYLTQSAMMLNVEGPGQRVTLRTTLNFEGMTLEDGELTFGAWGEGFIDKRHPHTLLHEFMLSLNLWELGEGDLSLSAGRGFVPYGSDDPMSRPGLKFPTNHHLSQLPERWVVSGLYLYDGWGVETSVFGGTESRGPYDFSNINSFGDSWSARVSKRWGPGSGPFSTWEVSTSYARVAGFHHGMKETNQLWNMALRSGPNGHWGLQEAFVEASFGQQVHNNDFFSVLAELWFDWSMHQPFVRVEYSSRPEYLRDRRAGDSGFFRYDQATDPISSTLWLTNTVAYAYESTGYPFSIRPFAEVQHFKIWQDGPFVDPISLFGSDSFWGLTIGVRVFAGGSPMRMGAYGALDPITSMNRMGSMAGGM